jgi:glycolate oxidase FAD binding subunit
MTVRPDSVPALQEIVRSPASIRVQGAGTKSKPQREHVDLRALSGIVDYSSDECVFTAAGGTPLEEIERTLAEHGQYLPFDPPLIKEGATIGGTVASGVSGPGRYRYGGVRDFLIGVRVVDGAGELIRSGGKVVKNAAGFLLHHGVVGSGGRFGIITEVTFKVFPAPEARRTLVVECSDAEDAFATAKRIENLHRDCESIDFNEAGRLIVTIAGRRSSVAARVARIQDAVGGTVPDHGDSPRFEGLSPASGTVPQTRNWVKVAGAMKEWQKVRAHVATAHFMCAGAVAWLATDDLSGLAQTLKDLRLNAHVVRGPDAGQRVGHNPSNEFEERVRRVLDPYNRFSAAPHPGQ